MDDAVCVLLADLHFGSDFDKEAEIPPIEHSGLSNLLGAAAPINQFFKNNCRAHDLAVTGALPRYLTALLLEARGKDFKGESFDLYVILGDVVTWPSASAFRFASHYIKRSACGPLIGVPHCAGLKVPTDRLICIPGNHDKLLQRDLETYHSEFLKALELKSYPKSCRSHLISKTIKGREFLLIVVDANVYGTEPGRLDLASRLHLARGTVSEELIEEVRAKLNNLRRGQVVDSAELSQYQEALKILILHYAVCRATVILTPSRH